MLDKDKLSSASVEKCRHHRLDWKRAALATVGLMGVLLGFVAWAVSSPIGSSPDDNYHLGSIWCPWPVQSSGCTYVAEGDQVLTVTVPESVARSAACFSYYPERSAACSEEFEDSVFVETARFDRGTYPPGYYRFHRLLVGEDVFRSIVSMRVANIVLGLGGLFLVAVFSDKRLRQALFVAATAAWVPMGVYYVSSNNPSSWAITGCTIYAAAMFSAAHSDGRRRRIQLVLMVFGALLASTSRADSSFYLLIITLALWLLVPITRQRLNVFLWSLATTVFGLVMFTVANQADSLTNSEGWPADLEASTVHVFFSNILTVPGYFVGLWGVNAGPGWFDTTLDGWSTFGMILVAGGAIFAGAREISVRKGLASVVLLGSIVGVPVVALTLRSVHPVTYYQPRYLLPLLAAFLMVWVLTYSAEPLFGTIGQVVLLVSFAAVANALALYRVIQRFSVGVGDGVDLARAPWWPWGISSQSVLVLGALAMAGGLVALAMVTSDSREAVCCVSESNRR